jgi:hypothetical protein
MIFSKSKQWPPLEVEFTVTDDGKINDVKSRWAGEQKTQTIAGITVTLEAGRRYYASRPALRNHQRLADVLFPVYIRDEQELTVLTIPDLSYEDANKFLGEFNNEEVSFTGRIW